MSDFINQIHRQQTYIKINRRFYGTFKIKALLFIVIIQSFLQMNKLSKQSVRHEETFDYRKCKAHRLANSYGMPLSYNQKCECCGKYAQKERLTLNFSMVKIYYCGPQLASYLLTIKFLSILLCVLCLTNAIPLMIINRKGKACDKMMDCAQSFMLHYSIFNQFDQHKKISMENYIIFANFIVCLVIWHILRNRLRKMKEEIDDAHFFPNQFGVLCQFPMENLGKNVVIESIQKWWRLQMKYNKQSVQKQFPDLCQLLKGCQKLQEQYRNDNKIKQIPGFSRTDTSIFIQDIIFSYHYEQFSASSQESNKSKAGRQSLKLENQQLSEPETESFKTIDKNRYCLVIFKNNGYAKYFSQKNNPNFLEKLTCFQNFRYMYLNKKSVFVSNQHYPSQILWKNHHVQKLTKIKFSLITIGVTLILLIIGSGGIFGLCILYEMYIHQLQNAFSKSYYVLVGFFINLMILIGNKIISIYAERQRHETYVQQKSSCVFKIVFFNVSLILVSPFIIFKLVNPDPLWGKNGFLETEIISLVIYMITIQIQRYLSPSTLKILSQYYRFDPKLDNINQKTANKYHNKPPQYIEKEYAAIITIMIINNFLSSYVPFITMFSCIWMLAQFWIQRANIAYVYNQDDFHSNLLSNKMVSLIEFSFSFLIFGSLSAYVLSSQNPDRKRQVRFIILYTLICFYCIASIFLPLEKINVKICNMLSTEDQPKSEETSNNHIYESIKSHFLMLYEDFNEVHRYLINTRRLNCSNLQGNTVDQLHTISASLSLTLKEKLLNKNEPIINHMNENRQENEEYFEYQKKINMQKSKPRINIPPLFQKDKIFRSSLVTSIKRSQSFQ